MEFIKNVSQFEKMIDNKIIGMPKLINSKINFMGKNNILVCDNGISLDNVVLDFNGDNSIVYISSSLSDLFHLVIYNNSTGFIGKEVNFGVNVSINILESQNVIIGDDCVIGDNVNISSSQGYAIYNTNNKERINFSHSIYIGDHVLIGNNAHISYGVNIGSGAIVSDATSIPPNIKIASNVLVLGNPAKIIQKDVFFINEFLGPYKTEDSLNSKYYLSDVFIYEVINKETLSCDYINKILNDLDVESRLDFIQKLFVQNKRKNRFSL